MKPANVLIAAPGGHVYLCDFGLARRMSSASTTQTGFFLGTADYCAPEQIEGRQLDARADVYSLGGVVFHSLTGQPPFARESEFAVLQAHLADLPPLVSELGPDSPTRSITWSPPHLQSGPTHRYASAGALTDAVREALADGTDAGRATRAAPMPPVPGAAPTRLARTETSPRPGSARRRWLPWIASGVLAALLVAGAVAIVASRGPSGANGADGQSAALGTFLDRMENVLDQSAAGRREVRDAISAGLDCSITPAEAARRIGSVADNRQSILEQLGPMPTTTAETAALVTLLQRALQESIEADRHYRDGFLSIGENEACPLPETHDFALATRADVAATKAKVRFAKNYQRSSPRRYGRSPWSPAGF